MDCAKHMKTEQNCDGLKQNQYETVTIFIARGNGVVPTSNEYSMNLTSLSLIVFSHGGPEPATHHLLILLCELASAE